MWRSSGAAMEVVEVPAETMIVGAVDEKQVHEVLGLIQALGRPVVSVRRVTF